MKKVITRFREITLMSNSETQRLSRPQMLTFYFHRSQIEKLRFAASPSELRNYKSLLQLFVRVCPAIIPAAHNGGLTRTFVFFSLGLLRINSVKLQHVHVAASDASTKTFSRKKLRKHDRNKLRNFFNLSFLLAALCYWKRTKTIYKNSVMHL